MHVKEKFNYQLFWEIYKFQSIYFLHFHKIYYLRLGQNRKHICLATFVGMSNNESASFVFEHSAHKYFWFLPNESRKYFIVCSGFSVL